MFSISNLRSGKRSLVGFQFGSGIGGALSIAGGTIIGGLVGGEIAEYLSEEEELKLLVRQLKRLWIIILMIIL